MKNERIVFHGVDSFSRPIFRSVDYPKNFFGSTDILVDYNETESDILTKVHESDLCFFGNKFECEPMGGHPGNIKIITKSEANIIQDEICEQKLKECLVSDKGTYKNSKKLLPTSKDQEALASAVQQQEAINKGRSICCGHDFWEKEIDYGEVVMCHRCYQFYVKIKVLPWISQRNLDGGYNTNHLEYDMYAPITPRITRCGYSIS